MPPASLGHYRIIRPLGQGGMGEVYVAEDTKLGRQVALKILPVDLAASQTDLERFEREARAVAALNHPNIVTIHSVEEDDGVHFLTMELVEGQPLASRLAPGGLSLGALLDIAIPLAEAVSAAHDKGIVHRDLKPANIMLAADGRLKVLDFGLAKLRSAAEGIAGDLPTRQLTGEGRIVGTVAYMSPEQAEGKDVDHRTDIFSLGIVLYELATGQRPFSGDTNVSVLSSVLRDTPKSATALNPSLPPAISRIIKTCLQKDPERRFQSAKDVRNELQTLKEELASGELDAPVIAPVPRRRGRAIWAGVAAIVLAVAVYAAARVFWPAATAGRSATFTQLTTAAGLERNPQISADGRWILYESDATGNFDIYLQGVGGETAINLTGGSPANDLQAAFSPDGERIAFRSNRDGAGIFVMGRTGESPRRVADEGFDPAWSPDGTEIVYATATTDLPTNRGGTSRLRIVNVDAGTSRDLLDRDGMHPAWSPDGRFIAFWGMPPVESFGTAQRDIRMIPAEGGELVTITDDAAVDWRPIWSPDGRTLYFASDRGGSMNLWSVAIDPRTGRPTGEPMPLTTPAPYIAGTSVSADGTRLVYGAVHRRRNFDRVPFDPRSGEVGPRVPVTEGSRYWTWGDLSPDGTSLALGQSFIGQEDIYVARADGSDLRQLTDDVFYDRSPRWSPDGSRIAFYSNRSGKYEIWTMRSDGGDLRQQTDTVAGALHPVWSPDGTRLAFTDFVSSTFVIDPRRSWAEQQPLVLPAPPNAPNGFFRPEAWSADSRRISGVLQSPGAGTVGPVVFDFDTGKYEVLDPGASVGSGWLPDGHLVFISGGALRIFDPATRQSRVLLEPSGRESLNLVRTTQDGTFIYFLVQTIEADIWMADLGTGVRRSR